MKRKYKKFLKAAYINYEEYYCGYGSGTFTKPTVTTPIIVITGTTATIACAVSGATIYYTLDGSTPTSSSTEYTGAITLTQSCTIKAIAVKPGMSNSLVASESYVHYLTQWKIVGNSEVHTLPYPDGVVLPNGYKRCKYLTFDGNSYINTGIKTANGIGYSLDFSCSRENKLLIGARKSSNIDGYCMGAFQSTSGDALAVYAGYGGATNPVICQVNYVDNKKHHLVLDSNIFRIDSEDLVVSYAIAESFYDIYLGAWNNGGATDQRMWEGNIYDTIIYNTQGELWHGIPCLDANDVPCFYDLVSQTAFYNQGSGSFTYKLYPQPTEIWSCGEYNATDGKYHILVQPLGGSIADIALDEPLRKVNDVADSIEFPSDTEGKALVTRKLMYDTLDDKTWLVAGSRKVIISQYWNPYQKELLNNNKVANILVEGYTTYSYTSLATQANAGAAQSAGSNGSMCLYDDGYIPESGNTPTQTFYDAIVGKHILLELATPTTELVDAPQIAEADSYTCVISQGAKAVEWSSFETE